VPLPRRTGQLFDVGQAAHLEVLRVEAGLAAALADRVRLAAALDASERDLARFIDSTPDETRAERLVAIAVSDTSLAQRDSLLARSLGAKHIAQWRAQLSAARAGRGIARSLRWPELKIAGTYIGWADPKGNETAEWNAAALLSLPIFTGGGIGHGVERADAMARGVNGQLRLAELQVAQDMDRALTAVLNWSKSLESREGSRSHGQAVWIEKLARKRIGTQTDYLSGEADLFCPRRLDRGALSRDRGQGRAGATDRNSRSRLAHSEPGGGEMKGPGRKHQFVIPVAIALAVIVWFVFLRPRGPERELAASGTVEAVEAQLGFQAAGRIEEILVREGDRVEAQSELARLDRTEMTARRSQSSSQVDAAALLQEMERGAERGGRLPRREGYGLTPLRGCCTRFE
jgi:hypothetical protein